jgi:hypothetical protein
MDARRSGEIGKVRERGNHDQLGAHPFRYASMGDPLAIYPRTLMTPGCYMHQLSGDVTASKRRA